MSHILIKAVTWVYIAIKTHQTLKWVHIIVCRLYLNKLTETISLRSLGVLSKSYG